MVDLRCYSLGLSMGYLMYVFVDLLWRIEWRTQTIELPSDSLIDHVILAAMNEWFQTVIFNVTMQRAIETKKTLDKLST